MPGKYIRLGGNVTDRIVHFPVCGKFCEFCGKFCEFCGKIRYPHAEKGMLWIYMSKGQMSFISFKEEFPKDYLQLARNVLNQLPAKFPANSVRWFSETQEIVGDLEGDF